MKQKNFKVLVWAAKIMIGSIILLASCENGFDMEPKPEESIGNSNQESLNRRGIARAINITNPLHNSTVSEIIQIKASIAANQEANVQKVEFYVDRKLVSTQTSRVYSYWHCDFNTRSQIGVGVVSISAVVYMNNGTANVHDIAVNVLNPLTNSQIYALAQKAGLVSSITEEFKEDMYWRYIHKIYYDRVFKISKILVTPDVKLFTRNKNDGLMGPIYKEFLDTKEAIVLRVTAQYIAHHIGATVTKTLDNYSTNYNFLYKKSNVNWANTEMTTLSYPEMLRLSVYLQDRIGPNMRLFNPVYFYVSTQLRKMLDSKVGASKARDYFNRALSKPGKGNRHYLWGGKIVYNGRSISFDTYYHETTEAGKSTFELVMMGVTFYLAVKSGNPWAIGAWFANQTGLLDVLHEKWGIEPIYLQVVLAIAQVSYDIYSTPPNVGTAVNDPKGSQIIVGKEPCTSRLYNKVGFDHSFTAIVDKTTGQVEVWELANGVQKAGVPNVVYKDLAALQAARPNMQIMTQFRAGNTVINNMKDAMNQIGRVGNYQVYGIDGVCHIYTEAGLNVAGHTLKTIAASPNGFHYALVLTPVSQWLPYWK